MNQGLKIPSLVPIRTILLGCLFAALGARGDEWIGFYIDDLLMHTFKPVCSSVALVCLPNLWIAFYSIVVGLLMGALLMVRVLSKLKNIEGSFFLAMVGGIIGEVFSILLLFPLYILVQPNEVNQFWIASSWILLPPVLTGTGVSLGFHRGAVVH